MPAMFSLKVKKCLANSFETPGDYESDNQILAEDVDWIKEHHLNFHPAITVNDMTFRGDFDFVDIREAICKSYSERPAHCSIDEIWKSKKSMRPFSELDTRTVVEHKRHQGHLSSYMVGIYEIIGVCFLLLFINCCIWMYLYRKTRIEQTNNVNSRVSAAIHEYFALSDHDVDF